jgi:hypothetical protein
MGSYLASRISIELVNHLARLRIARALPRDDQRDIQNGWIELHESGTLYQVCPRPERRRSRDG